MRERFSGSPAGPEKLPSDLRCSRTVPNAYVAGPSRAFNLPTAMMGDAGAVGAGVRRSRMRFSAPPHLSDRLCSARKPRADVRSGSNTPPLANEDILFYQRLFRDLFV